MIDRKVMLNAFLPATELDDPERFAGRSKQVRELADSLNSNGATPLIYGDRGLGKSSLALQLRLIAMGGVELLHQLDAARLALPGDRHYLTFYVTCTDSTQTLDGLLQALVNSAESVENVLSNVGANQLIDRVTRKKLTLKFVEVESTKKYEVERQRLSYQDLNLEEKLVQLCELLTSSYGQPVLFVVDELDRMRSTTGLASFLKAASSESLKFMLVGIASNVSDLLSDHQSLERRLQPVKVPLMTPAELGQIVTKAEAHLKGEGVPISFSRRATVRLTEVSAGFPWFVHVLGQQCLIDADANGRSTIELAHVEAAIRGIVDNRFAQQFSDMYQSAVRDSFAREKTLRAFAHWTDADIPTGEIYKILSQELGLNSGSTYRGHLCKPEFGDVLFVPTIQKRGLVRFRNEMFKAYVRLRPSIYHGLDKDVAKAYSRRA
jgi:Cdc6-like AAA superfamily ATPase